MTITTHPSIFSLTSVRSTINTKQLQELITFIAQNRQFKMDVISVRNMLAARSLTSGSIGTVFNRALELHKETLFSFLRIPPSTVSTPEVVTYNHVTFDLKQLQSVVDPNLLLLLKSVPEFSNTILLNATTLLKRSGEPIDVMSLQYTVVRDLLSRSYYDNKTVVWLTPSLLRYLCRFYNMSMSASISVVYNLTFTEQQTVATVFSLYFMQRSSDADTAEALVKSNSASLGLGTTLQVQAIISRLKETLKDAYTEMSLSDVCTSLGHLGIARLETVTRAFLYTRQRSIGPDALTSAIALEYPPYWCALVISVMAGRKMGLTNTFKRNDLVRDAPNFLEDLITSQSFLPSL